MLAGKLMIPKVFEVLYDYDENAKGRATWVRGGDKETEVRGTSTSWVLGDAGGDTAGMVIMARGDASHRLRLQSSL
jgi:hypothetical protein